MTRTIGRSALAIVSLALVAGLKLIAFSLPNAPRNTSVGQH